MIILNLIFAETLLILKGHYTYLLSQNVSRFFQ